jgi:adenylate cyclase
MAEERVQRRLAAILSADVVGYSRLMGADEAGTLSRLNALRRELIDPTIAAHSGRIVKLIGDGALVEFGSAVDAVTCAIEIQRQVQEHDAGGSKANPIQFRIGINVGDIIIEGDDIYGDGVNIAARLESIAEPGGISISEDAFRQVRDKLDVNFQDSGEQLLKNIARPVRVYQLRPDAPPPLGKTSASGLALPDKASIAVLPFTNMSGDPEQEYFSDGISEDIITDLSKIAGLMVISRNSCFTYKGRSVDTRTVGRDLGVRSVLEGSIRRSGGRVRITAQLIDALTGGNLWAERYDRDLTDIFAVQDDVTRRIVDALKVTLSPAEKARLAGGEARNVEAYDFFMRGREFLYEEIKNREKFEQAKNFFMKALELDPSYSLAYAGLSWAYEFDYFNRWSDNADGSLRLAKENADKAVEKDPKEPLARVLAAMAAMQENDLDRARSEVETALVLNPNFALAYNALGDIHNLLGRPQDAIPAFERAMRLDPAWSQQYLYFLGTAYLLARKYETAAALFRQRILLVPRTDFARALLAAALGHLNEIDEARRVWGELMEINPQYAFREHFGRRPFRREDVERVAEGLAKSGLPS